MKPWGIGAGTRTCRVYGAESAPETFEVFRDAVALWRQKARQNAFPSWQDYDIPDFRGWFGQVSLARVVRSPFDAVFEFYGTALSRFSPRDMTGHPLSELFPAERRDERDRVFDYIRALWREKGIGIQNVAFETSTRESIEASVIDLIVGKRSHNATHILSYLHIHRRTGLSDRPSPTWRAAAD